MKKEELDFYKNRIYFFKDSILNCVHDHDYVNAKKYSKEFSNIKKILKKALKESKYNANN